MCRSSSSPFEPKTCIRSVLLHRLLLPALSVVNRLPYCPGSSRPREETELFHWERCWIPRKRETLNPEVSNNLPTLSCEMYTRMYIYEQEESEKAGEGCSNTVSICLYSKMLRLSYWSGPHLLNSLNTGRWEDISQGMDFCDHCWYFPYHP